MNAMKLSYILAAGALMVSAIGQAQVNQFMKVSTAEGTYLYDATDATKGTVVGNFIKINGARLTTIKELKEISMTDEADYRFVKPEKTGTGDGSTWENAMGIVEFCATISAKQDVDAQAEQVKAVDGKIFCFSGGEFPINANVNAYRYDIDNATYVKLDFANADSPVHVNMIGGFDPASTGKDITKRDKTKFATIFNGNNPTEGDTDISDSKDYAGFYLQENVVVNANSITFKFFYGNKGGAFSLHGSGAQAHAQLNTLECAFVDNRANDGGAAINQSNKDADCHNSFKCVNTYFSGNKAPWGAIAKLLNSSATNYLINCEVTGNRSDNGGLFRMENNARFVTLDCNFHDNEMRGSGGNYGCIVATVWGNPDQGLGKCDYRADGCRFVGNHTQTRCIVNGSAKDEKLWFNNCYFENNTGDDQNHILIRIGGLGEIALNNCTIIDNNNGMRGAVGGTFRGLILNTTIIGKVSKGLIYADDGAYAKVGNSIVLSENGSAALWSQSDPSKKANIRLMGNNIIGSISGNTVDKEASDLIDQAWIADKFTINTNAGLLEWDGQWTGHQNANLDDIFNAYDDPTGYDALDFIDWVNEMGSVKIDISNDELEEVFDATGALRNPDSIWAGAYQK